MNLPPPPPPPSGKKSSLPTPVSEDSTKNTERIVCDAEVDKDIVDHKHSSCTDHATDSNDSEEKSLSCVCTTQNQTIKTEKFYTVSARDRSIVSCSLSNRTSTVSVLSSVMVVDIDYLDEQIGPAVTASSTSDTPAPGANSPKTTHKEVPKPKKRLHRPSAVVSQVGDVMSTGATQSQKGDRTGEVEVSQPLTGLKDQCSVNRESVMHQRVKPPPPPKKPAVAKLLRTRINGSAGDSSDDGLTLQRQVGGDGTAQSCPCDDCSVFCGSLWIVVDSVCCGH